MTVSGTSAGISEGRWVAMMCMREGRLESIQSVDIGLYHGRAIERVAQSVPDYLDPFNAPCTRELALGLSRVETRTMAESSRSRYGISCYLMRSRQQYSGQGSDISTSQHLSASPPTIQSACSIHARRKGDGSIPSTAHRKLVVT